MIVHINCEVILMLKLTCSLILVHEDNIERFALCIGGQESWAGIPVPLEPFYSATKQNRVVTFVSSVTRMKESSRSKAAIQHIPGFDRVKAYDSWRNNLSISPRFSSAASALLTMPMLQLELLGSSQDWLVMLSGWLRPSNLLFHHAHLTSHLDQNTCIFDLSLEL